MLPEIYWIPDVEPGRLGMMARPRGGEWLFDEIKGLRDLGVSTVVTLLQSSEIRELGLENESSLCAGYGIRLVSFPVVDRGVPSSSVKFFSMARELAGKVQAGATVVVHCRAGIGRSGLTAAAVLTELGRPVDQVFELLTRARGLTVPDTVEQGTWFRTHRR